MFTNNGYALLIGVDDYAAFDASSSRPTGTSNLPGSRNDVKLWWRFCRQIGIKPEHIRVLASPPIDAAELEGAIPDHVGEATQAEILDKAAWLGRALADASHPTGILTYSGHGDWVAGKGLVLCPVDAAVGPNEQLVNVVSYQDLNDRLAAHADNLTVVLDTCHSGPLAPVAGGRRATTLTRRPLANFPGHSHGKAPGIVDLAGRVLSAAKRDQLAYQVRVDGKYHGVFSWALVTASQQWHAVRQGHNVRYDVCYGTLVETAGRLMSALYLDQVPEVHGPSGVASLALLRQGLVGQPGETVATPDRTAVPAQIDPGAFDYVIYTLTNDAGYQLGQILVTATASASLGYEANKEYWYLTSNLSNTAAVTFAGGSALTWSTTPSMGTLSFVTARSTSWQSANPVGTMLIHTGTTEWGLQWNMAWDGSVWTGNMTWYSTSSTGTVLQAGHSYRFPSGRFNGSPAYSIVDAPGS